MHDKLPALEGKTTSEVVSENLNAMHAARKDLLHLKLPRKFKEPCVIIPANL